MKDLSGDARALLDAAVRADSAPPAIRHRGRNRLIGAVAAGTVASSAVVAQGAWLGVSGAAIGTGTTVGATTSLTATLVSAVAIGLSTGLVAISPASQTHQKPPIATQVPTMVEQRPARPVATPTSPVVPHAVTRSEAPEVEAHGPVTLGVETKNTDAPRVDARPVVAPRKPTKISIGRETELLGEVQRALKTGHATTALAILDRYSAEHPAGQLCEEAMASRVVALCALGRVQGVQRWAAEFLRRYPDSPLLARVRGACPSAATPVEDSDASAK